jgi:bisphosphoglycerate-dependent phosphoglycerate mutase
VDLETRDYNKTPFQEIHRLNTKKSNNENQFLFWLDKELSKSLKKEASKRDYPIKEIICEGIALYF